MSAEQTSPAPQQQQQHHFSEETIRTYESKRYSEHFDPCQEAANKSIRCIHRNPGNKDLCNDYFQAYRDCKKAWTDARREAKFRKASEG